MSQENADALSDLVTNGVSADGVVDIKSVARLDTDGKTVDQVSQDLCRIVRGTELEPEWLCHANMQDDANEGMYGARHSSRGPSRRYATESRFPYASETARAGLFMSTSSADRSLATRSTVPT